MKKKTDLPTCVFLIFKAFGFGTSQGLEIRPLAFGVFDIRPFWSRKTARNAITKPK
jgi:hypothetical protein